MFNGCLNLEYINIKNFVETKLQSAKIIFNQVPENVIICINEISSKEKLLFQLENKTCYVIDCTDDWKSKQKKLISNNNECIESCDNSSQYPYEYNGKCYENCFNGFIYDENHKKTNKCKCELDKCLVCPKVGLDKNLCIKCNINYYPKENDPSNIGEYINCYKDLEGYYLDNNLYKLCYYTCKTCNISGNNKIHNCIECNDNYSFEIKKENYLNCYENCSYYYYFDDENNYHCTIDKSCPNKYPKLSLNINECTKNYIKDIIEDLKRNETEKISGKEEIDYYDNIINIIEKELTSDNYDTSKLDIGQDEVIKTEKMIVTLTTPQNQKSNISHFYFYYPNIGYNNTVYIYIYSNFYIEM